VVPVDRFVDAQPYAMRAPEVILVERCMEPSQIWAVVAMLLCWKKYGIGVNLYLIISRWLALVGKAPPGFKNHKKGNSGLIG
jgi:hypothetical protein